MSVDIVSVTGGSTATLGQLMETSGNSREMDHRGHPDQARRDPKAKDKNKAKAGALNKIDGAKAAERIDLVMGESAPAALA
ncbi:hypothetical protein OY671_012353 [Metschnikowia pulcherrima]|nr:hypothetical protein OY671_012353 [Metschnikowia pulcherrima]